MDRVWQLQDAKAHLSLLVENAQKGNIQIITKRGKEAAVIISYDKYKEITKPSGDLVNFFNKSPLKGTNLDISRNNSLSRDIDL